MSQESLLKQLSQLTHLEAWNLFQENASGHRSLWEQVPGESRAFDPQGQPGPQGWETSGSISLLMEKEGGGLT